MLVYFFSFIKRGTNLSYNYLQPKRQVDEEKEKNQKKIRWLDRILISLIKPNGISFRRIISLETQITTFKKEKKKKTKQSHHSAPKALPWVFFLIRQLYQVVLASSKNSKSNKIFTTTTGTQSCNPHFCVQYEATSSMLLLHGFLGVLGKRKRWIFWTVNHRVQGVNSRLVSFVAFMLFSCVFFYT